MPISPNKKFEVPERKQFEAIPADMYQVQITDISEKLKAPYGKPFDIPDEEKEEFLSFEFTILDEGEYRGRKLWKDMRPVPPIPPEGNFKPSLMFRIVSAIQGHATTYASAINWGSDETNALIGQQLRVAVTRTEKGEKVYNNITEFFPVKQVLNPIEANNEPQTQETPQSGYEKAKAVSDSLVRQNVAQSVKSEAVAPDIAESAQQMTSEEISVEDIPF